MKQKNIVIFSAISLILIFIAGVIFYTGQQEKAAKRLAEANLNSMIRMHSPSFGKADAPVVIVEFFDPACETCAAFYPKVKQMIAANPGKIRLVLRYAPFHNGSDKVVAVLEAARKQGKFWPTLEALLNSQSEWVQNHAAQSARIWHPLEKVGLNLEQLAFDMASPEIAAVITQDLADAKTLNVTMTPEYFVNGKPLPSFGLEQLQSLVEKEVAAAKLSQ
jgi:protein-disulfide isomerase